MRKQRPHHHTVRGGGPHDGECYEHVHDHGDEDHAHDEKGKAWSHPPDDCFMGNEKATAPVPEGLLE